MVIAEAICHCNYCTLSGASGIILATNAQPKQGSSSLNLRSIIPQAAAGGRAFFLDGPGGTGKTFVYGALLASVRAAGNIALGVASSGIAALLMEGGTTAHFRFKLPIPVNQDSLCKYDISPFFHSHSNFHFIVIPLPEPLTPIASLIPWSHENGKVM